MKRDSDVVHQQKQMVSKLYEIFNEVQAPSRHKVARNHNLIYSSFQKIKPYACFNIEQRLIRGNPLSSYFITLIFQAYESITELVLKF